MSDTQFGRDLCATERHIFEDGPTCLRCGEPAPAIDEATKLAAEMLRDAMANLRQVSATPERVWEDDPPVLVMNYPHPGGWHDTRYVPESRLLAAEARVREVEKEMSNMAYEYNLLSSQSAQEIDALRADLAALVPLARYALWVIDTADYDRYEDWVHQEAYKRGLEISGSTADPEVVLQARAILDREGT